jgi:hypothetical protein
MWFLQWREPRENKKKPKNETEMELAGHYNATDMRDPQSLGVLSNYRGPVATLPAYSGAQKKRRRRGAFTTRVLITVQ